jgi:hypothetical protein
MTWTDQDGLERCDNCRRTPRDGEQWETFGHFFEETWQVCPECLEREPVLGQMDEAKYYYNNPGTVIVIPRDRWEAVVGRDDRNRHEGES